MVDIQLKIWDYLVLFGIVLITSVPGLFQAYRTKKAKNDLEFSGRGGKHSNIFAVAMSLAATRIGIAYYLGVPNDVYKHGAIFFWYAVAMVIAIPIGAWIYLPVFFNNNLTSMYAFLEHRYDVRARKFASVIHFVRSLLNVSLKHYTGALALHTVTGLEIWVCAASTNILCVIYSSLGGFRAVVLTDVIQLSVVIAALLCVIITGYNDAGGFLQVWRTNVKGNRTNLLLIESAPEFGLTLFPIFIGSFFRFLGSLINQSTIQRCLHTKSLKMAIRSALLGWAMIAAINVSLTLLGLVMYTAFADCDPLLEGQIKFQDQRIVLYAAERFTSAEGMLGFFFAGLVCSSISSFSTSINTSSCMIMEDIVKPFFPQLSPKKCLVITKLVGLTYAGTAYLLIFVVRNFKGVFMTGFLISGVFSGPVVGMFTLGMISPWTSTVAAVIGTVSSALFMSWITIGRLFTKVPELTAPILTTGCNLTDHYLMLNRTLFKFKLNDSISNAEQDQYRDYFPLSSFSPYWYQCWSILLTICFGLIATAVVGPKNPEKTNSKLLFPIVLRMIRKIPLKLRRRFGFRTKNSGYFDRSSQEESTAYIATAEFLDEQMPLKVST